MATKASISIRRDASLQRIEQAATSLSQGLDIPAPVIPHQGRDADLLNAQRLEAIADWLEGFAEVWKPAPQKSLRKAVK